MKPRVAAVLVAAGSGSRYTSGESAEPPKQFLQLRGRPLYMWSLSVLVRHGLIDRVVVVTRPDLIEKIEKDSTGMPGREKVVVTAGGSTRQDSVRLGLELLSQERPSFEIVLVHDSARPFLDTEVVDGVIQGVTACGACTVGVPVSDTVKVVEQGIIKDTLDRSKLYAVQTPQAARFAWLLEAHRMAVASKLAVTDDAALLEHFGHEVRIVEGSPHNFKVTVRGDLEMCEALASIFLKD